jgi:hypothetical protein
MGRLSSKGPRYIFVSIAEYRQPPQKAAFLSETNRIGASLLAPGKITQFHV